MKNSYNRRWEGWGESKRTRLKGWLGGFKDYEQMDVLQTWELLKFGNSSQKIANCGCNYIILMGNSY